MGASAGASSGQKQEPSRLRMSAHAQSFSIPIVFEYNKFK